MSKTKIVAILTFVGAIVAIAVDAFDGNGFDFKSHAAEIAAASGSVGLFFLRDAIQKVLDAVGDKK